MVAAGQQVEQDRRGHDRHPDGADGKAAPGGAQPRHHPVGRRQAEGRAARQHQRVDLFHGLVGGQQIGLAGAGGAAHDADPGGEGRIGGQHRHPGFQPGIGGIADAQPVDIGDQVARSGDHVRTSQAPR